MPDRDDGELSRVLRELALTLELVSARLQDVSRALDTSTPTHGGRPDRHADRDDDSPEPDVRIVAEELVGW